MKKLAILTLLFFSMLFLSGCKNNNSSNLIFYYSLTCPHCKNVEQYVTENNIKEKILFVEKEVSENQANAADFYDKIKKCGIKPEAAGVPLLWNEAEQTCLTGDEPIISYFFEKMKELSNVNSN